MVPNNEMASKPSCLILSILIFVVLPFSLLALGLLLWYGRESSGRSRLKARMDSLSKQGDPVDNASVESYYRDRTSPANTDAWLAVLNTVSSADFKASTNGVPYVGIDVEPPVLTTDDWKEEEATLAFLERWKSLHAEVLRLSIDAKPVRFPIVFDSFATLLPQTHSSRDLARLLQLQGRVGLRTRDSAVVRDAIDGLLGLSRVNAGEPFLVSQLVSMAIDGVAIGLLKDAVQHDALSEADLLVLLPKVLAATRIGTEWQTTIAGERGTALPVFIDPKKAQGMDVISFPGRSCNAAGDAFIRRALQHRIATLAIGLRLYEDRKGKLPASLNDLSELPMDLKALAPTKDRSFGYRRDGNNAKLWGGTFQDAVHIPTEPPAIVAGEPDHSGKEFWLWEFRAVK